MPVVKVQDLSGKALDYAVALCQGAHDFRYDSMSRYWFVLNGAHRVISSGRSERQNWNPSTNWTQGGSIIDKEGIDLYCNLPTSPQHEFEEWRGDWRARYCRCGYGTDILHGRTALIAAMRCYVASKLGNEVEIPTSLL